MNGIESVDDTIERMHDAFQALDHTMAAVWASDCAERVIILFEGERPGDERPREAIEAAYAWVQGAIGVQEARRAAFEAHAAAREALTPRAKAAARAAGHAAATAHVPTHAMHAATYARKAARGPEVEWQSRRIREIIRAMNAPDPIEEHPPLEPTTTR